MKTNRLSIFRVCRLGLGVLTLLATLQFNLSTIAQVTTFTYQGRLIDTNNSPANGLYDFRFTVYVSENNPGSVAGPILLSATPVTNGLFTVTLDFGGSYPFPGFDRWLGIEVRTNGSGPFTALSPRQEVTPTPYAITAQNVLSGGLFGNPVNFNNPNNSFSGNGGGLTNVNATTLDGFGYCALPCYWNLDGNAGTVPGLNFLGTADNQPLTLRVNNSVALRIDPAANGPNMVAGLAAFKPTVITSGVRGAVVAGGGAPAGPVTGFGAGDFHAIYDSDCTIGGGFGNKVGNGNSDVNDAPFGTVGGGVFNGAANYASTVAGGDGNLASGVRAAIGGGSGNQAVSDNSTVSGGDSNIGSDAYATVGGGGNNQATGRSSFVGGGGGHDSGGGGPYGNIASGDWSTVGGGWFDVASGYSSTVGGGAINHATNSYATVPGGAFNIAGGLYSFAAGQEAYAVHQGSFVWADSQGAPFSSTSNDEFCVRAQGGIQLSPNTSVFCGNQTRQMLNLWGTQYGIGVQNSTTYFRCDSASSTAGFSWFKGGVHNDNQNNPGGGVELMRLNSSGVTVSAITITGGADLAEPFEISASSQELSEGAVVVIDEENPGQLKLSDRPYDTHVAGVLSGANGINPGIQLRQQGVLEHGKNVALTGRVFVQVDTANGAVKPGDLLTTSATPGYAMKVTNHARAQGAILGKAMTGLSSGKGMVLVLVSLQ